MAWNKPTKNLRNERAPQPAMKGMFLSNEFALSSGEVGKQIGQIKAEIDSYLIQSLCL